MFFGHPEAGMFSEEDERMVSGIAVQSAIAIENARLYQERTRTAQTLQRALLPPSLPEPDGLVFAAGYRAAGAGNEVGGDFYDVFEQSDGSYAVVVGDVCGKGPQAAAVTALARYTLRAHAVAALRPSFLLARLNEALLRQRAPGFVTVALARVELTPQGARMEIATAGHPAPILARDGAAAPVGEIGTPLGIIGDPELPEVVVELEPGDVVAFYTDGVTEAAAPRVLLDDRDVSAIVAAQRRVRAGGRGRVAGAHGGRDRQRRPARRHRRARADAPAHRARGRARVLGHAARSARRRRRRSSRCARRSGRSCRPTCGCWPPSWSPTRSATPASPEGKVAVRVRLTGDVVHLSVADDGPGFQLPEKPLTAPNGPGGWGLYLVDQCAVRWGAEHGDRHVVWLELERKHAA